MALNIVPKGNSRKEKVLRLLGMIVIFAIVGWAFWQNNERTLEKLQGRNSIWDQTKSLSKTDRDFINGFIRSMRSEFGVKTKVHIMTGKIPEITPDSKELFIGLSPEYEQVVFYFPGLVRHALGANFINDLKHNHFTGNFKNDKWPVTLQTALAMIWEKLISVDSSPPQTTQQQEDYNSDLHDPESSPVKE
ncbi:hypothetical protein SAMN05660337_0364 [Maridesulfovibrio ferrireducens]|uniref:TPM domain-containing protein n=1 Tax=Maridesulfovibrio ferrireducens TaxID=246191 RepID=A0A1G9BNL3_9BACT|nr:hypothetical protein [Maridesulfovibrio ferrireducens]SDK41068.1 hypothetical protein SAMN05660337_0364 [Maridesulfovibrio ferrireducens]